LPPSITTITTITVITNNAATTTTTTTNTTTTITITTTTTTTTTTITTTITTTTPPPLPSQLPQLTHCNRQAARGGAQHSLFDDVPPFRDNATLRGVVTARMEEWKVDYETNLLSDFGPWLQTR
jgi:hypothetical protein